MKNPHAVKLGKLGGSKTSEAKKLASRLNGKKGGRPKLTEDGESKTLMAIMTYKEPEDEDDNKLDEARCFVLNPFEFSEAYRGDNIAHKLIPLVEEDLKKEKGN